MTGLETRLSGWRMRCGCLPCLLACSSSPRVVQGNISTLRLVETDDGIHVDSHPEAVFYNLQHLVDYFSFVRHNHLGLTLYRDADAEAEAVGGEAIARCW